MVTFSDYSICACGAVTLFTANGESYSCSLKNRKQYLPDLDLRMLHKLQDSYCCDHCVNHYGMDLCACGSGAEVGQCDNAFSECGRPAQMLGRYTRFVAPGSWLF